MDKLNLAALLSFVWPGLGQAYRGERGRALVQAFPQLVFVVAIATAVVVLGPLVFAAHLFNPVVSLGLVLVVVLLAVWRSWSIVDAAAPGRTWRALRGRRLAWTSLLLAIGLVVHAWLGYSMFAFYRAGQEITLPIEAITTAAPSPSSSAGADNPTPDASANPGASPTPLPGENRRVTILLVGVDNTHLSLLGLTDTLIVASFDPGDHSLVMVSLPRDVGHLPYYGGGQWGPRINSLLDAAIRDRQAFPDGPMATLEKEISFVVGVPIDYYAEIGISGFTQLIDAVGGVDVVVDTPINDPTYQFSPTEIGFHLDPGSYHLNGKYATAFARSRHGSSDYARAARQQQILLALRNKLKDPVALANLPGIVDSMANIIRTDVPLDRLPEIVSIAQETTDAATRNIVLGPPTYAHVFVNDAGERTNMTQLNMDAVAALSIELFGADSLYSP